MPPKRKSRQNEASDDTDRTHPPKRGRRSTESESPKSKKTKLKGKDRKRKKPKTKGTLKEEGIAARKEIKSLKKANEEKGLRIQELEATIHNLSRSTHILDDTAIRNRFEDLRASVYDWTRNYSSDGPLDKTIWQPLKSHQYISSSKWLSCRKEGFFDMVHLSFSRNLFLNTMLVRFLYDKILLKPFVAIPKTFSQSTTALGNQGQQLDLRPLLQKLAGLFKNNDKYAGLNWISHTLEIIYPSQTEPTGHKITSELQKFYEDTATEFCESPVKDLLEKKNSDDMRRDLILLVKKTDELRIDIWKGRVDIRPHVLGSMKLGEEFQPESDVMKAHCTMSQNTAAGSRLVMVIEPAIGAYWINKLGEEKSKVWSKAIVWAGDPSQMEEDQDSDEGPDGSPNEDLDKDLESTTDDELDTDSTNGLSVRTTPQEGLVTKELSPSDEKYASDHEEDASFIPSPSRPESSRKTVKSKTTSDITLEETNETLSHVEIFQQAPSEPLKAECIS